MDFEGDFGRISGQVKVRFVLRLVITAINLECRLYLEIFFINHSLFYFVLNENFRAGGLRLSVYF